MKSYFLLVSFIPFLFMGCQSASTNPHEHSHEHGHSCIEVNAAGHQEEHEDHNVEQTLWSDQSELFVEYHPLVVGLTSTFTAHFTNLKNNLPYESGKLTISLIKGKKGIRQTVETPTEPGIFSPALQPNEAGEYALAFDFESGEITERFTIDKVKVYADEATALSEEEHEEKPNRVNFTKEQSWKVKLSTQVIDKHPFRDVIKTTGELISANGNESKLVAQTSGVIHFQSNEIVCGKTVNANETLFYISGRGLSDNNLTERYINAKSEFEKARANYDRAQNLHKDRIISEKNFLEAKTDFEKASIKFELISKDYSKDGIKIKAPSKGFISQVFVTEGEFVEKGQVLGVIDKNAKLVLKADVYQKELHRISEIRSANFKLPYSEKIFTTGELGGKMIAFGKDLHKSEYTTPLFFEIAKTPELYTGTFVEVFLQSETFSNVLAIPKSAILEDQGTRYVFVQEEGESFNKHYVTTGADNGQEVQILEGLKSGDRIVTHGAYFVRLASLSGSLPAHSHNH